jgi:hypothetical protein
MITVKVDNTKLKARLSSKVAQLDQLPDQGLAKFKSLTPIKSGNARANTDLKNNNEIVADYAYAKRLDRGWSRQAPIGMVLPFKIWWRAQLKKIMGK